VVPLHHLTKTIGGTNMGKNNKYSYRITTKCNITKLSKIIEYASGARVEIPIHPDGSIRWFDDSQLIKK
jgi:hypothetical protein